MSNADQTNQKSSTEEASAGNEHSCEDFDAKLSQQHSSSKGGISTDMLCPSCDEEICGFYLPTFRCPHCSSKISRDEEGKVTSFENTFACPECGRGSANEVAKEKLINGSLSLVHAFLLYGLKMKHVRPEFYSVASAAAKN